MNAFSCKIYVLRLAKFFGVFCLTRFLSRKKLRILCYHGFSIGDQSSFRQKLFVESKTFKYRINYLIDKGFTFINKNQVGDYLNGTLLPDYPVLITIDDGWKSTHDLALPILKKNNIPHIIYLYTDCFERNIPVINVLLQYALWKTSLVTVEYEREIYFLNDDTQNNSLLNRLNTEFNGLNSDQLNEKLAGIFRLLKVDYSKSKEWEYFRLLNQAELQAHLQQGGSFQLHTHHHINPLQDDLLKEELKVNRRIIESVTGQTAEHFCYPSGVYSKDQFPLLKRMGIKSAVTCIPGLNDKNTHPYELKRFLDGENISQIEFEAEMSGFLDICRRILKRGN